MGGSTIYEIQHLCHGNGTYAYMPIISYYNKRNAHFDVQELLFQFWTERRETWQEYGEA